MAIFEAEVIWDGSGYQDICRKHIAEVTRDTFMRQELTAVVENFGKLKPCFCTSLRIAKGLLRTGDAGNALSEHIIPVVLEDRHDTWKWTHCWSRMPQQPLRPRGQKAPKR
ncbi:hypothetical protein A0H81_12925 [Grifola frondosa]|uniref:Uncharacterized protein n=1 Tax=Grifola frondosa TaxID=5627 RepID=A0A1C7LR26_GRIFR|nr:hypothetical protein A0H81_12925 [Grifola frondosa]